MKIVQSFWSKPSFHNMQNYSNSRKFGGWLDFRYFLVSSALSCLSLKKYHGEVDLYTDDLGSEILVDVLRLPYDDVSLSLNALAGEDHRLWILGKVLTIREQTKSFVHVDNDVYVWDKLPSSTRPDYIVAQSQSPIWTEYRLSINEIYANFAYVPECYLARPIPSLFVDNVGVVGGNNLSFFQNLCEISYDLLEKNRDSLELINLGGFNQMLEEYLFTCLAKQRGYKIDYLITSFQNDTPNTTTINLVPFLNKYIHLVGLAKQSHYLCEQISLRLELEFPDHYKVIKQAINDLCPYLPQENFIQEHRRIKLLKAIQVLYENEVSKIKNLKISICRGIEVVEALDELTTEVEYFIKQQDINTGNIVYKKISQSEGKMVYDIRWFSQPITINEVFGLLAEKFKGLNAIQEKIMHTTVLDSITRHIVMNGILEFT